MAVQACRRSSQVRWCYLGVLGPLAKARRDCSVGSMSKMHAGRRVFSSLTDCRSSCARLSSQLIFWAHLLRALCSQILSACHCWRLPHWSIPHSQACSACRYRKMVAHLRNKDISIPPQIQIQHLSLTTTCSLPLSTRQTSSSNAPPLWMRCAIIRDESQWLLRLLLIVVCALVLSRLCAIHLNDVHRYRYFRRN